MSGPSPCLVNHVSELELIAKNPRNRKLCKAILENPRVIDSISELVLNLLSGNIELENKSLEKKLKKSHQKDLLALVGKNRVLKKRILLSPQRGSFLLSAIVANLLPQIIDWLRHRHDSKGTSSSA